MIKNKSISGDKQDRMGRELTTIAAMVGIYCGGHHGEAERDLCSDCAALLAYARRRLERCRFQENKTTCANCPVHCYNPDMRERVRQVMRYAGPRMIFRHPVFAVCHLIDGFREKT